MFEDYSDYSKEKVRLFLKYLAYAASRHVKKQNRENKLGISETPKIYTKKQIIENLSYSQILKNRLSDIDEDRREELENKIKAHYFNNQFLPYENKLKRLKSRYSRLKKKKNKNKKKLTKVKEKIDKCDILLKKLKKARLDLTK